MAQLEWGPAETPSTHNARKRLHTCSAAGICPPYFPWESEGDKFQSGDDFQSPPSGQVGAASLTSGLNSNGAGDVASGDSPLKNLDGEIHAIIYLGPCLLPRP